ncbi:hypothetical protein HYH02_009867 [Chlamydomonas schloesseri]|uniref:Flavin reductase like domain-containing protein n=1 Tax=Chlamydomonas schloesseri TaxID=2026947 RepID=A0A835W9R6_9CHLO|nr:hypothetical protein HYH02_009867 [Chlamydomonas schloesseri]|eukprot:KAG2442076.1 hypothetical protein HYH02_009867 [Chlamydomonas schloesseri]
MALVAAAIGAVSALGLRELIVRLVNRTDGNSAAGATKATEIVANGSSHTAKASSAASASSGAAASSTAAADWQPARHVQPPHPDWKPGQPQPCPLPGGDTFIEVDTQTTPPGDLYPLVISAAVPRPVAFISSVDSQGGVNLSPYSFFNAMGFNPPTVAIGLCHSPARPGGKKDTLHNIEETGEFVVNVMSEWFVEAANHTCGDYPRGVDEMRLAGLTPLASTKVRPPRVAESAVHMECRLRTIHHVKNETTGAVTTSIAIGEVLAFHVSSGVAGRSPSGKLTVDMAALAPVARCGGVTYARCTELYELARPDGQGRYPGQQPAAAAAAAALAAGATGAAKKDGGGKKGAGGPAAVGGAAPAAQQVAREQALGGKQHPAAGAGGG